jgi:hypothetical protein
MARRRACAVSNHEARGPSFETPLRGSSERENVSLSPKNFCIFRLQDADHKGFRLSPMPE